MAHVFHFVSASVISGAAGFAAGIVFHKVVQEFLRKQKLAAVSAIQCKAKKL